jgi:transposase-like protein
VDYGKKDVGNIGIKSRKNKQVYCKSCKSSWVISKGTMFYNLKKPLSLVLEVLLLLSEGMGVNAIFRAKGVKSETISSWIIKASGHVEVLAAI